MPLLYVRNNLIEYAYNWHHLDNILDSAQNDSKSILYRRCKLFGQINDFLCFVGNMDTCEKTDLLYIYIYIYTTVAHMDLFYRTS